MASTNSASLGDSGVSNSGGQKPKWAGSYWIFLSFYQTYNAETFIWPLTKPEILQNKEEEMIILNQIFYFAETFLTF